MSKKVYIVRELDQVKALTDPLRSKILEVLVNHEMTTKQVAQFLGEPPTKLYRHVDTLHKVGLIDMVRTNQKNGITEKYYRAVGSTFRIDQKLFAQDLSDGAMDSAVEVMLNALENTVVEVQEALKRKIENAQDLKFTFHQKTLNISTDKIEELNNRLTSIIDEYASENDPNVPRYRVGLIFYPQEDLDENMTDQKET